MNETIILAGGCFWCTEAIFKSLKGVVEVVPGYAGGTIENPTYEEVSSGESGHAESVKITFNPREIQLSDLLEVFFKLHDSTTLNRQGADEGSQYRSSIFYFDDDQKKIAQNIKSKIRNSVTEILPFKNFFPAEEYHREYYFKNKGNAYCSIVIDPKIQKLRSEFKSLINS